MPQRNPEHPGPLSGVVIADFSRVLAGPYATMLLADMGATVIKVESPAGDETRHWKPPVVDDTSTYYLSINRNKHAIALDLKDPEDLETAKEIIARADILVENFKPGNMSRFGLEYESVTDINPEIIYTSITGFGTQGGATMPGYDLLVQAMSGFMSLTGESDGSPYRAGVAIFDVITGLHTAIGILSALNERNSSGRGQLVETNLMSSALSGLVNQTGGYVLNGEIPHRMGNEHPSIYPYSPLKTGNGDLVVTIGNDGQFQKLCHLLNAPHLSVDARFSTPGSRSANRNELRQILEELLAEKSAAEWFELLSGDGLPCAPINNVQEGVQFAEKIGLEPVITAGTNQPGIRNPIEFSRTPAQYPKAPPHIDEDRENILSWLSKTSVPTFTF
ncbi:MAG: CoA transferase [Corynebacterium glutamicum]|nr:CoA transferase [Corynebacterium glutamicum]